MIFDTQGRISWRVIKSLEPLLIFNLLPIPVLFTFYNPKREGRHKFKKMLKDLKE